MPGSGLALLIALDGVVHSSDLPVQSFARHVTEQLAPDQIRPIIAGMRGYLEHKSELIPGGVDLADAEDGDQAVETLARTAGLTDLEITAARRAARADLAASAWAVDAADGLEELLAQSAGRAAVVVRVDPGDPAGTALLDALGLAGGPVLVESHPGTAVVDVLRRVGEDPQRVLVIGTRWRGELDDAALAGCATALIDRYDRRAGRPTWRARTLAELLDPIRMWLARTNGGSG